MSGASRPPVAKPGRLTMRAPAKVNLHLEVIRQRHDGYHEIETILQSVGLFDTVGVELVEAWPGGPPRIEIRVAPEGVVPVDETNLCWRAARHFCRQTRCSGHLRLDLHKEIPVAAGLGGGSSDAAAVLVACDRLFGTGLDTAQLESLAADLGSDVPFFIRGGTALARGTGIELTVLPRIRHVEFLVVKPDLDLLTRDVYGTLRMGLTVNSAKASITSIKSLVARFPSRSWFGFNRLEEVVLPAHPTLQRLVLRLRELATVAMVSGSGAAVVAAFEKDTLSSDVLDEFAHPTWFVRVVEPMEAGVLPL